MQRISKKVYKVKPEAQKHYFAVIVDLPLQAQCLCYDC